MEKKKIRDLTLLSMFSAIVIAMTFIPYVGYITIPGLLSITTLHVAVIIGCVTLNSLSYGAILGAVWGITCLLYALANGTADAAIFLDPRISVIPRILVGFLTVVFYRLALKASENKALMIVFSTVTVALLSVIAGLLCYNISSSVTAAVTVGAAVCVLLAVLILKSEGKKHLPVLFAALGGTFSNTVLVLFAISLFASDGLIRLTGTIKSIYSTVIALNGTVEIIAASAISVPCCVALSKVRR